jgi:hypothetical protein
MEVNSRLLTEVKKLIKDLDPHALLFCTIQKRSTTGLGRGCNKRLITGFKRYEKHNRLLNIEKENKYLMLHRVEKENDAKPGQVDRLRRQVIKTGKARKTAS